MIDQPNQPRGPYDAPVSMRLTFWLLALLVGLALAFLPTSCADTQAEASATNLNG